MIPALMWIGMLGGFMFILIQLILIVDFAHGLAEKWVDTYEENDSRFCFAGLISFSFGGFLISLVAVIMMFIIYTSGATCALPKFFISFNMLLCIGVTALSILPFVQEQMPRSGLLQSSFITMYVMYLTWAALVNNPGGRSFSPFQCILLDHECNPSLITLISNTTKPGDTHDKSYGTPLPAQAIISLVLWFLCVLYASIRNSSNTSLGKITGGDENQTLSGSRDAIVSNGETPLLLKKQLKVGQCK